MVILVSGPTEEDHPLVMGFEEGNQGIPTFDTLEEAQAFAQATEAIFGSGWKPLELHPAELAKALEPYVHSVEYAVLSPPPQLLASGGNVKLIELNRYVEILKTHRP